MRITLNGVFEGVVGLLALQGGAESVWTSRSTGDEGVKSIAQLFFGSMSAFAQESYKLDGPICFIDHPFVGNHYTWLRLCDKQRTVEEYVDLETGDELTVTDDFEISAKYVEGILACDDVFQDATSGQEKGVILLRNKDKEISDEDECLALKGAILEAYIDSALLGEMDPKSAYGPHKAFYCKKDEGCSFIGDLLRVNGLSEDDRGTLMKSEQTLCAHVVSQETPNLLAIVFGSIPKKITNICESIFNYYNDS